MKVRIVCYEDVDSWILGKFALKLQENLRLLGIDTDISKVPDKTADINHHIIYYDYMGEKNSIDTIMITHIDNIAKRNHVQKILHNASMGICMSKQTMEMLGSLNISNDKLCYINPAHDNIIVPRPKVVGITCRVQTDGRKREHFLNKLAKDISPKYFSFRIMGEGWEEQVESLKNNGFEVNYQKEFNYNEYVKLIPTLDYYLYMGEDEGQMGYVDALAAGVETIVTPQGYHLDALGGIVHPFSTYEELLKVFTKISEERERLINSVSTWNWMDYTKKHLELWKLLLGDKNIISSYTDGLNSISTNSQVGNVGFLRRKFILLKLQGTYFKHSYNIYKNALSLMVKRNGIKYVFKKVIERIISSFKKLFK